MLAGSSRFDVVSTDERYLQAEFAKWPAGAYRGDEREPETRHDPKPTIATGGFAALKISF
jgi:hypothetical protein